MDMLLKSLDIVYPLEDVFVFAFKPAIYDQTRDLFKKTNVVLRREMQCEAGAGQGVHPAATAGFLVICSHPDPDAAESSRISALGNRPPNGETKRRCPRARRLLR
jgi:hypothetical protein